MLSKLKLNLILTGFILLFIQFSVYAGRIKGIIFDDQHNQLPFSSITVKETNKKASSSINSYGSGNPVITIQNLNMRLLRFSQ